MSKKPQKPQPQQVPKKQQIVDQQNEPFLRTIAKRVRNINKKLTEIDELKKKGDLKPEQAEKLNRRVEYEQQRSRLEGIADFYRETYAENVEQYRNNQLQELDQLANAIAVLRANVNWKEADKLEDLNRALTEQSTGTLAESSKLISQALRRFANDFKLKKSVQNLVSEIQGEKQTEQKTEEKPAQQESVPETKVETKYEPKQTLLPHYETHVQPVYQQTPVVQLVQPDQPQVPVQQPKVEQTKPVAQEVPAEQKPTLIYCQRNPVEGEEPKPVEGEQRPPRRDNRTRGDNRGPRGGDNRGPREDNRGPREDNRGPRENRGPKEFRQPREPRVPREPRTEGQQEFAEKKRYDHPNKQKPNYKPKNQDQEPESDSDSSLEREVAMRNFKKEEIRQLQDDGFQVVGKPKPKAKQGQKEWHDRTHGRKAHHHHQQPQQQHQN